jgi:hypothetical protein
VSALARPWSPAPAPRQWSRQKPRSTGRPARSVAAPMTESTLPNPSAVQMAVVHAFLRDPQGAPTVWGSIPSRSLGGALVHRLGNKSQVFVGVVLRGSYDGAQHAALNPYRSAVCGRGRRTSKIGDHVGHLVGRSAAAGMSAARC